MHDVLAHRLSLLAVHAGGLEFHRTASPEEVARIAGVIRSSTHQALDELREVISVLRDQQDDDPRPQPTLANLATLVEESRAAGLAVACTVDPQLLSPGEQVGTSSGRTAYRVVQEALTNARKHAPGGRVAVAVSDVGDGIEVRVLSDARRPGRRPDAPPGSGTGLIGLRERVGLAGGRIDHGPLDNGQFQVEAWLPHVVSERVRT
jgi:signal transduction histidine kinase